MVDKISLIVELGYEKIPALPVIIALAPTQCRFQLRCHVQYSDD